MNAKHVEKLEEIYRRVLVSIRRDHLVPLFRKEAISTARAKFREFLGVSRLPSGPWERIEREVLVLPEERRTCRMLPPELTIQQRLEEKTKAFVLSAFQQIGYRRSHSNWAGGNTSYEVEIGDVLAAKGRSITALSQNGKWRGNDANLSVTVSRTWLRDVYRSGLAILDGLLTLSAISIEGTPSGVDAWQAVWVEQGRGFDLNAVSGVIVRRNGQTAHAQTLTGGLAILSKRKKASQSVILPEDLAAFGDLQVTLEDSSAAGNCPSGTRDWIARHFPGRESATIREVLAVQDRQSYALRACRKAVERATTRE